jgi:beta-galactosidase
MVGPRGFEADGQDVALIDVEVLDAKGQRCPTDDARIDFAFTGPAVWRGGYNSGKTDSEYRMRDQPRCSPFHHIGRHNHSHRQPFRFEIRSN